MVEYEEQPIVLSRKHLQNEPNVNIHYKRLKYQNREETSRGLQNLHREISQSTKIQESIL